MSSKKQASLVGDGYMLSFFLITFFFFLWGFARAILDVLNPFFQETLALTKTEASAIQFVTYLAYFIMAVPAGIFIRKHGTRKGVVLGLIAFGLAAVLFYFNSYAGKAAFFYYLSLLFVIGCGLACLEVAANPYVTLLGAKETAASRLNRAQSFNGLGCIFGSLMGGFYCFSNENPDISYPYVIIGIVVLVIAVIFSRIKLPEFVIKSSSSQQSVGEGKIYEHPMFLFGLFALFCYEVSEISINSFFINYAAENDLTGLITHQLSGMNPKLIASIVLSIGLLLFMGGRFIGSWIMEYIRAEKILLICAISAVVMTSIVVVDLPVISLIAAMFIFVSESIMFPTIFALSIRDLGGLTQKASSILMMTPIGGAVGTVLMGMAADESTMTLSFMVPLISFAVVLIYAYTILIRTKK